jgi:quercetin dioxygenase-like cupin family protein
MNDEIQFLDNRARIHASAGDTGGFALIESDAPPGSQPPLHVHLDEDEGFYLLDGELTLWIREETRMLRPGEFLLAPRQVPHTIRVGDGGARWLLIAGARFEAFVRAVGALTADPDPIEMTRLAARHGIDLLGPPGMLPTELAACDGPNDTDHTPPTRRSQRESTIHPAASWP